jgi:hypothetical protein
MLRQIDQQLKVTQILTKICVARHKEHRRNSFFSPIVLADGNGTMKNFVRLEWLARESQLKYPVVEKSPHSLSVIAPRLRHSCCRLFERCDRIPMLVCIAVYTGQDNRRVEFQQLRLK